MVRRTTPSTLLFVLLMPGSARAAFVTCGDAEVYGENTARGYVLQALASNECNESRLAAVHRALSRALATMSLDSSDADAEKLCFYRGLWGGLLSGLSDGYAACGLEPPFSCLERVVLAAHAGSILHALAGALADRSAFAAAAVPFVFETEVGAEGAPLCSPLEDVDICTLTLWSKAGASGARYSVLADDIARLVCAGG